MPTLVRKRYDERPEGTGLSFDGDSDHVRSVTKQSFAAEADINNIMQRYSKTGVLVDPTTINNGRVPQYGDFSDGADYLSIQNRIALAQQSFDALPSNIRTRFGNNPAKLIDFMADPANLDACVEMGLVEAPDTAPVEPEPPAVPEPPVEPIEAPVEPPSEPE